MTKRGPALLRAMSFRNAFLSAYRLFETIHKYLCKCITYVYVLLGILYIYCYMCILCGVLICNVSSRGSCHTYGLRCEYIVLANPGLLRNWNAAFSCVCVWVCVCVCVSGEWWIRMSIELENSCVCLFRRMVDTTEHWSGAHEKRRSRPAGQCVYAYACLCVCVRVCSCVRVPHACVRSSHACVYMCVCVCSCATFALVFHHSQSLETRGSLCSCCSFYRYFVWQCDQAVWSSSVIRHCVQAVWLGNCCSFYLYFIWIRSCDLPPECLQNAINTQPQAHANLAFLHNKCLV